MNTSKNTRHLGVKSMLLASISLCPGIIPSTGKITSVDPRIRPKMISTLANILTTIPEFVRCLNDGSGGQSNSNYEKYCSLICNQVCVIVQMLNVYKF
ncbi:unnamed protein product [Trichobilharzia regenti]|nr:unnamed protein product [Trichobilharzia regenti]